VIFVSVGTHKFNELIETIDGLAKADFFNGENVICQIGSGEYVPQFCEYFRYSPDLNEYLNETNFIFCHGGTGSVIDCLNRKLPFLPVANSALKDDHQTQFLLALSNECGQVWARSPSEIMQKYHFATKSKIKIDMTNSLITDLKAYIYNQLK